MTRPAIITRNFRTRDLYPGDVIKTRLGQWACVIDVKTQAKYAAIELDNGTTETRRDVALASVQVERDN